MPKNGVGFLSTGLSATSQLLDIIDTGATAEQVHQGFSQGTILPGVTRQSVIELARLRGYIVEETAVPVREAVETADEIFTTGTAVVVSAVGRSHLPGAIEILSRLRSL